MVAAEVLNLGKGAQMGKMDTQQAYRNILVDPKDRRLLDMLWQGNVYIDAVLPFGIHLTPLIFLEADEALEWMMIQQGTLWVMHYLDEFFTLGPRDSPVCRNNMEIMVAVCSKVGLPVKPTKTVGPATTITFLGMELDSLKEEIRLPQEKLHALKELLQKWHTKTACRKRELLSLLGLLKQYVQENPSSEG